MKGKSYSKVGNKPGKPTFRMPSRLKAGEERRLNAEPMPLPKKKEEKLKQISTPRFPRAR